MNLQRRWAGPPLGRLAVIGAGQIGGSVALGARVAGAVTEVVAWSRTREKLDRAQALGVIDRAAGSAAEAARGAALVVLATPVRSLGDAAAEIASVLEPGALVFDVGSVKAAAIAAVEPKLPPGAFVACHPIAGTERVGPDAASPLLFEGRRCVLCPTRAQPRGGDRDDRAAVGVDGRRAGADGRRPARSGARRRQSPAARRGLHAGRDAGRSCRPTCSRRCASCRRPACATRPASRRPARSCGATS